MPKLRTIKLTGKEKTDLKDVRKKHPKAYMRERYAAAGPPPLRVIGDITCDIDGSVEFTAKSTTSDNPVFVYDPTTDEIADGWQGNGPVIVAVDILPSELPRDASLYFSNVLKEFVPAIAKASYGVEFSELALPDPIKRAVILHRGQLTPDYEYISKYLD